MVGPSPHEKGGVAVVSLGLDQYEGRVTRSLLVEEVTSGRRVQLYSENYPTLYYRGFSIQIQD